MRSQPPHPLVRFRFVLLGAAIASWAVAFAVLALLKGNPAFPVAIVVAAAAVVFVWTNGAFWWLEMRYPHIESSPGKYVSRAEQASGIMRAYSGVFFGIYGIVAVLVTITCLRVGAGA